MDGVPATGSASPEEQQLDGDNAADVAANADLGPAITPATGYEDPVCLMKLSADATERYTHDGVTYGFCSATCKKAFSRDPDDFLVALEE